MQSNVLTCRAQIEGHVRTTLVTSNLHPRENLPTICFARPIFRPAPDRRQSRPWAKERRLGMVLDGNKEREEAGEGSRAEGKRMMRVRMKLGTRRRRNLKGSIIKRPPAAALPSGGYTYQDADADAAHVEAIKELMDFRVLSKI